MAADRDERTQQYFAATPGAPSARERIDVVLPDRSFTMETDRGVFAHQRLDTGTALLLREAGQPPPEGDLLDLGCGAGAIAVTLALRSPGARVWAVDVNDRAVALCRDNAARNRALNVEAVRPDEVPDDVRFAAIWSNPPIRIGKSALHDLLRHWLGRLRADGAATLVVQRHLGADSLHRWLTAEGFDVARLLSKSGFRVLRVTLS